MTAAVEAPADEFFVDSPLVRDFVAEVREVVARRLAPVDACELIRPRFADLLASDGWLPERFQEPAAESGMGGGIGQWLLYRTSDGSLSLLTNDTGCVWRHTYDPLTGEASPFRSGYVNVACTDDG